MPAKNGLLHISTCVIMNVVCVCMQINLQCAERVFLPHVLGKTPGHTAGLNSHQCSQHNHHNKGETETEPDIITSLAYRTSLAFSPWYGFTPALIDCDIYKTYTNREYISHIINIVNITSLGGSLQEHSKVRGWLQFELLLHPRA